MRFLLVSWGSNTVFDMYQTDLGVVTPFSGVTL
jgi:hypothetical protein